VFLHGSKLDLFMYLSNQDLGNIVCGVGAAGAALAGVADRVATAQRHAARVRAYHSEFIQTVQGCSCGAPQSCYHPSAASTPHSTTRMQDGDSWISIGISILDIKCR
jgi:hypothetical protein